MNESSTKSETTANKLLSTGESLALLDRLRQAVRDVTSRAAQIEREFSARSTKLTTQYEQDATNERDRWSTAIDDEQVAAEAKRVQTEAHFSARKTRIANALENATKRRLSEVENDEDQRTSDNQSQLLEVDRKRDVEIQNVNSEHSAFAARLADEQTQLAQLESRARWTLGGYGSYSRRLKSPPQDTSINLSAHENDLVEQIGRQREAASRELTSCQRFVLPLLFRVFPVWLCVLLILLLPFAFVPELRRFDFQAVPVRVWEILGGCLAGVMALYFGSKTLIATTAMRAIKSLKDARALFDACVRKSEERFAKGHERVQAAHANATKALNQQWKKVYSGAKSARMKWTLELNTRTQRLNVENDARKRRQLARLQEDHAARMAGIPKEAAECMKQLETGHESAVAELTTNLESARKGLEADWQTNVLPLVQTLRNFAAEMERVFPPWRPELWERFDLPEHFPHAAKFAMLAADLEKLCEVSLSDRRFGLQGATQLSLPLLLSIPRQASVLFETKQSGQEQAIGALNNLVLRLLTSGPPGRVSFTIFDPVGLGQNFAGIMHLADFEERLINSRIWTQQAHIEQRLADLNEHIEKVTQMYLRNEYETLAEYNAQAGRMAEKYHFLVIADFPVNFTDIAVKRLQSVAASGPRCGVHLLVHWDQRKPAPADFVPDELRKNAICIVPRGAGFALANAAWNGTELLLDTPPDADLTTKLLQQIGRDSRDSYRVEMPFGEAAPSDNEMWSLETTDELRVPIGRTGATKLQYLALGEGTRQHGLIAGKTGSGKSTLFHVVITNLSLWCSPEQVEFYLVDFKKGVEFKCYAMSKLPHARVVAIESDREFGLSVLQRVDEELKRRGDLFRKLGAQDIAGYKKAGGKEAMPRTLLLIDEFQEFFVEDDRISQSAALLLDRIVRQGRAFGIHVLLGSQTLGGAYTLARATIGQMVVRIALQCNEADAYLIMSEDNPAPRLLSRPGEAIYNDDGGSVQGNSPFQVVWLPDDERDKWLERVGKLAKQASLQGEQTHPHPLPGGEQISGRAATVPLLGGVRGGFVGREPVVFEGNAPAGVRENLVLRSLLDAQAIEPTSSPRIWLGAPNSIKGPTEAVFQRQSGHHLLIVGQNEEMARAMLAVGLVSLAAQRPEDSARFLVFDCSAPDSPESRFLERVVRAVSHEATIVGVGDVAQTMSGLSAELERRADTSAGATGPETYLFIHGLPNNKKLRYDEELSYSMDPAAGADNPGLQLNKIITEGASLGFHVIATCDTYNNVMRSLSRKALSEFEMRVVFQMSANDSASLIETGAANNLGLYRAILFNGQQGLLETFRPYALPDHVWLDEAEAKLKRLHGAKSTS